jgi:hypothetical protein
MSVIVIIIISIISIIVSIINIGCTIKYSLTPWISLILIIVKIADFIMVKIIFIMVKIIFIIIKIGDLIIIS